MSELVVAANRGPFSLAESSEGAISVRPAGGGLAPSLASALAAGGHEALWIATATSEVERRAAGSGGVDTGQEGLALRLVAVDRPTYRAAYDVVANATLWFSFHGLFDLARRPLFDARWREAWDAFRSYNSAFAERIAEGAASGARVLVNDYHLPLVGKLLAEKRPDLRTVHFTHTPFAEPQELRVLPRDVRRELMEGMAGFGACGFHTERWRAAFGRSSREVTGRSPRTFVAPLGVDLARLEEVAATPECSERTAELAERVAGRSAVVRSDRMELSKNILRGLHAFDALLEARPDLRGRCCLVARAYASREGLPEYLAYRSEVEHLASLLNEKWSGSAGGEGPVLLSVGDDFPATVAALRLYDVLLVNPVRDGMNLVAKEGSALNERDGLVVLSEEAGAYEELGDVALGVQPYDVLDTAAALARALDMPTGERRRRAGELRARAAAHPPSEWLAEVLARARRPATPAGA